MSRLGDWLAGWQRQRWLARLREPRFAGLVATPPPGEYVSLDCEMSSLDPRTAEILSIAAVKVCGRRIALSGHLQLLVRPSGPIAASSIPIHGLRTQDVAGGLPLREALAQLLDFIGPRPVLGYYLEFDLAVIDRALRPWLGVSLPNRRIEVSALYYARMVHAYRPDVDLSLESMLATLALPQLPRHDPLNDAVLAALIFLKLQGQGIPGRP
ncbi:3'-5' exonuclease [Chitinilyticum litopenaei]|uniref:3'-5' exonuclease n=1 Tax=Chitinilyticum litopenaei TaxID=1121276 RepID=UPI000422ACF0|nr:3'-5' exonuclease [Chitinilyticum litopenaei]